MLEQLKDELEGLVRELCRELGIGEELTSLFYNTLDMVAIRRGKKVYYYLRGVRGQERKLLARIQGAKERELAFRLVHTYRSLVHLQHLDENLKLCGLQVPVNTP